MDGLKTGSRIWPRRRDLGGAHILVSPQISPSVESAHVLGARAHAVQGTGCGTLAPITTHPRLFNVNDRLRSNDRWTYHYCGKNQQLDYLLVSQPLQAALQQVAIERRGIFKVEHYSGGAVHPFPTGKTDRDSASDHGAVVAEFVV